MYIPTLLAYTPTIFKGNRVTREVDEVDKNTGEVKSTIYVERARKPQGNGFGEEWFAMNQAALDAISESDLHGREFRVLFKLLKRLNYENHIPVVQSEIAEELKLDRGDVSKAIKRLLALEVIERGPKMGRCHSYILSVDFAWKGKGYAHREALRRKRQQELDERMESKGLSVVEGGKA